MAQRPNLKLKKLISLTHCTLKLVPSVAKAATCFQKAENAKQFSCAGEFFALLAYFRQKCTAALDTGTKSILYFVFCILYYSSTVQSNKECDGLDGGKAPGQFRAQSCACCTK